MNSSKILLDLRVAIDKGYCGIGQDSATIFRYLSNNNQDVAGLLFSANPDTIFSRFQTSLTGQAAIEQTSYFFHELFHHQSLLVKKILRGLKLSRLFVLLRRKFNLHSIDPVFIDVIWRNVLGKYIEPSHREELLNRKFYYTGMTAQHIAASAYLKKNVILDTTGFDHVIFPDVRAVTVSKNTTKIVRYHDAIPLTDPDFTPTASLFQHATQLAQCVEDSYFVCNSGPTRDSLINLYPKLEEKSFVIPPSVSRAFKKVQDGEKLHKIMSTRLSSQLASETQLTQMRTLLAETKPFDYILNIATLDPKKNLITLIRAWEKLNLQNQHQIKLVVLANRGWFSEATEEVLRPHVEQGSIIHLQGVTGEEMEYLYSHAKAFVFPSYTEGFGSPPLEALHCECPVIAANIPSLRWVLGEAALYCDPYNPDTFTSALEQLLYSEESYSLQQRLITSGLERTKLYSHERLSELWMDVLNRSRFCRR